MKSLSRFVYRPGYLEGRLCVCSSVEYAWLCVCSSVEYASARKTGYCVYKASRSQDILLHGGLRRHLCMMLSADLGFRV